MGSVCNGYMCILLYMKIMWCSGFTFRMYIYPSMVNWRSRRGVSLPWVYVHSALYETYVM